MSTAFGEMYILWDVQSCPVPEGFQPEDVVRNINSFCGAAGPVKNFSCSSNIIPPRLKDNNVKALTSDNSNADVKAMMVDMLVFALDHSAPAMIMLMSSAKGFNPVLHTLANRGYTIVLIVPDKVYVSESLLDASNFIGDWPSLATGKGFLPPILPKNKPPECGIENYFYGTYDSDCYDDDTHDSDYDADDDKDNNEDEEEHGENYNDYNAYDDYSDSDDLDCTYGIELNLLHFKMDLTELIVCCDGFIYLHDLEYAYELRYKRPINYQALGATGMGDLMDKVSDKIDMFQYPSDRFIVLNGTRVLD